jgi:hypothetical protein
LLAVDGVGTLIGATLTTRVTGGLGTARGLTTRTYRQLASPPELLSRVMATVRFVSWGAIPVGGLVAGALAGPLGARTTLLIVGAAAVLAPLSLLFSPVRGQRDLLEPGTAVVG